MFTSKCNTKCNDHDNKDYFTLSQFGIFNATVTAKNRVTEIPTFDDVMVIVTDAPCAPPKIIIPFNSTNNLAPVEYFRADQIVISTSAELNCTPVITTKYGSVLNKT